MQGEELGRRSLQLDATYCALVGLKLTLLARWAGRVMGVNPALVSGAGSVTMAWSRYVARAAEQPDWRPAVATVGAVNAVTAAGIGVGAGRVGTPFGRWILRLVAVMVGGFAVSQAAALVGSDRPAVESEG